MKKTQPLLVTAAAGIAGLGLGLTVGVPSVAGAQESVTSFLSSSVDPEEEGESSNGAMRDEERRAELAERLAEELGLDTEEVAAALEKVGEEMRSEHGAARLADLPDRLDKAVEDGRLTQEQADDILERAEAGEFRGRGGRGGPGGGHRGHGGPGESGGATEESATPSNV